MTDTNIVSIRDGEPVAPDFVTRVDINSMSDAQLDEFIGKIRLRRMASFIIYQTTLADAEAVAEEKAKTKLDKKLSMVSKTIETLDKNFEKLETQINEVRGLRIQAGLSVI